MIDHMPPIVQVAISEALDVAGYTHIEPEYDFDPQGSDPLTPDRAPMDLVAFLGAPYDQSTSAIAVRWFVAGQDRSSHLKQLQASLWTPYAVLASNDDCQIWDIYPELLEDASNSQPQLLADHVSYDSLNATFIAYKSQLSREAVATKKRRWRQMALYEMDPEPNAFLKWAYQPTRDELTNILGSVFAVAEASLGSNLSEIDLQWLLRLIGVRIVWDKRWLDPGDRTSAEELVEAAKTYPTYDSNPPPSAWNLAAAVVDKLSPYHLRAADGGLLSQLLQEGSVSRELQKKWKLYPTPQHVAWRMLATLPIETIPAAERRAWDGTCGSGTILVATLERLRALMPNLTNKELRDYLVGAIAGNDLAPALSDAARIALDLALGALVGTQWRIGVGDVAASGSTPPDWIPNIIVGNPPFNAKGHTKDVAISVIDTYLGVLPPGGLLSVVVPRSLLGTDTAKDLRKRLLREIELYEVWQLPSKTFKGTQQETAVLMGRKPRMSGTQDPTVTWRFLPKPGSLQDQRIDTLLQSTWREHVRTAIQPPLACRLEALLQSFPRLSKYVPTDSLTQGIIPGIAGTCDIVENPEPHAVPYLFGREDMRPFFIQWNTHPLWLRYESPRLHRPRRKKAALFTSPKVLITRLATWGSTWRVQAAIEMEGIYPGDQFVAMVPLHPMSLEFVAALFNSALANYLLAFSNPSNTITIQQMLQLPVPNDLGTRDVQRIEEVAQLLHTRRQFGGGDADEDLANLTRELDTAIYDVFSIPSHLRRDIAEYFRLHGTSRPGFDGPMVEHPAADGQSVMELFADQDNQRMQLLFDVRQDRQLSREEEKELRDLVARWQVSYTRVAEHYDELLSLQQVRDTVESLPT